MYALKIDSKEAMRMLNNLVDYSDGFIKETKAKESTVASRLASTSISGFYQFLDSLARVHPTMLHHIYEWGQVGNPGARLVELKKILAGRKVEIGADFLESQSSSENGGQVFYDKAEIMEEGISVTINEVDAQALFFVVDGEEFFRHGPIVIENPGGVEVRGSFVRAFEEFYNVYFDKVYLDSIKFYDHFRNPREYETNFSSAMRASDSSSIGRMTALSWVMKAPGDYYE